MKTTANTLLALILSLALDASLLADDKLDAKPLKAVFSFQLCVREVTEIEIPKARLPKDSDWASFEGEIWNKVLDKCGKYFGDEQKGLVLLYFDGDTSKALGFYAGAVTSARAYVLSRTIDVQHAQSE